MTKLERAIKAIEALPEHRREEIAELVLEIAEALNAQQGVSALTPDQIEELRRRGAFQRGDPSRIDRLLSQLK